MPQSFFCIHPWLEWRRRSSPICQPSPKRTSKPLVSLSLFVYVFTVVFSISTISQVQMVPVFGSGSGLIFLHTSSFLCLYTAVARGIIALEICHSLAENLIHCTLLSNLWSTAMASLKAVPSYAILGTTAGTLSFTAMCKIINAWDHSLNYFAWILWNVAKIAKLTVCDSRTLLPLRLQIGGYPLASLPPHRTWCIAASEYKRN